MLTATFTIRRRLETFSADTLTALSAAFAARRDALGVAAKSVTGGEVSDGNQPIGVMTYNAKVWDRPYDCSAVCIYSPYAA